MPANCLRRVEQRRLSAGHTGINDPRARAEQYKNIHESIDSLPWASYDLKCNAKRMMSIVDFHTHAFPDSLAERAVPALAKAAAVPAHLDGTLESLLRSMDRADIECAVVASIATKPGQFESILNWSRSIASSRVIPFASVHPADDAAVAHLHEIIANGIRGIKLHPYYQDFDLDEPRMLPLYSTLEELGLIVLCHTGFDMAYPRTRRCDPVKIARVLDRFPDLRFVATHLGAWEDWDEVSKLLIGRPVYLDTAYSIEFSGGERAREMILAHPAEYVLFGSDSPWDDQGRAIMSIRQLGFGAERERLILGLNARRLLGMPGGGSHPPESAN